MNFIIFNTYISFNTCDICVKENDYSLTPTKLSFNKKKLKISNISLFYFWYLPNIENESRAF